MRHRLSTPNSITASRPNRTPRRSASATTTQLRREHVRSLAWFSI